MAAQSFFVLLEIQSFDLEYEAGGREREVPAPWVRQRFASSWPPPPVDDDGLPIVVVDTTTTTTTASTDSVEQVADSIPVLPSSAEKSPSREVETNAQPQSLKASPVVGDLPSPTHIEVVGQRFREPVGDNRRVDSLRNALATAKLSHYYEVCTFAIGFVVLVAGEDSSVWHY